MQGGNVPPEEIEAAQRTMDPRTFDQEYNAGFRNYKGVVYYCFDRQLNHTNEVIKRGDTLHIGMDFNVEHMSAIVYVMRDGLPCAVDEHIDLFDTPAMIARLQQEYSEHSIIVYPDASGKNRKSNNASESDLSLLRDAGYVIRVNKANPSVKDRVMSLNSMLCNTYGERRLKVNTDKCPKLTEALERQIYDDKGEPSKEAKLGYDHPNDAAGYPMAQMFPIRNKHTGMMT
ncbi:Terminase-like family [Yersinia frederiksenii]|nr:Terminase-like family [Yersinia frederiksenii]